MKPDWFLVANATHARLLQKEPGCPMVVLQSFYHPESRMKPGELGDDRAGREASGHGFGSTALEPHADAHRKQLHAFAHQLAAHLEQAAQAGRFHRLAVFASEAFLGELRQAFGHATQALLSGTHDADYTAFGLAELEQRVAQALSR